MALMKSRWFGYAVLLLVYAVAAGGGIMLFMTLPLPVWASLLIADVTATILVFLFSVLFRNASVYDPYWILLAVILFWAVRLTLNWAYTFHGLAYEDWRYTMYAEKTGRWYPVVNLVGIHLMPTLIVYACTMPAVHTFQTAPEWNIGCILFCAVSLFAAVWQGVADCTLHSFKKRGGKGFVRRGVWKYSRHPNYLGEILMWWGIGLAAVCVSPAEAWWLLLGALANTCLFLFVSIPLADGRQARKEGFAEYRASTRMLLPIPRFGKSF